VIQRETGVDVLGDVAELELGEHRVLLQHGDRFCTGDWRYQVWRRVVRSLPGRLLLNLVPTRRVVGAADRMRDMSQAEIRRKPSDAMGISDAAIARAHRRGFDTVICGHVHQAQRRRVAGAPANAQLITLGAWHDDWGSYAAWDGREFHLEAYSGAGII
jgi:UDP-2,3-diacylglucosamine hydrolase